MRYLPFSALGVTTYDVTAKSTKQDLLSPNYPRTYLPNTKCNWIITAENGSYVYMKSIEFRTYDGNDYMQIHDHATDDRIWTDSGSGKPGIFFCGTGGLRVYWHVNDATQSGAWKFEYWTGEIPLTYSGGWCNFAPPSTFSVLHIENSFREPR